MDGAPGWTLRRSGSDVHGENVDPLSLVMTALMAGAVAGARGMMTTLVNDAYAGLKALVRHRFKDRPAGEVALEKLADNPDAWEPSLKAELAQAGVADDPELVAAAQHVLSLFDPEGAKAGRYQVDARGAQGVQIGDHGTQSNIFNAP